MVEATDSSKSETMNMQRQRTIHIHPEVGFLIMFLLSSPVKQWKDMTVDICFPCLCFNYKIMRVSMQEMLFGSVFHLRNMSLFMGTSLAPGLSSYD